MSKDTCGDFALDDRGKLVAAWDMKRAIKDVRHKYFCVCPCGDTVTLHRGDIYRAHFAYKAQRRDGCTGSSASPETEIHYNAKWLLSDIFSLINFRRVCVRGHEIGSDLYATPEWTATVEKAIPGTKKPCGKSRIADVLLENSSTGEAVALEVYNTHAVGLDKQNECKEAGVTIIEVQADKVTLECRELDNQIKVEYYDCNACRREDEQQEAQAEEDRKRLERIERDCEERRRKQNEAREARQRREDIERQAEYIRGRAERERREEIERPAVAAVVRFFRSVVRRSKAEQQRKEEIERHAVAAVVRFFRSVVRRSKAEQQRKDIERRAEEATRLAMEKHYQRVSDRHDIRRPFIYELQRLEQSLLSASATLRITETVYIRKQHVVGTAVERTQQNEEYNACKRTVADREEALELHKESGRSKRSRLSRANAGCIACAGSTRRCAEHNDSDRERWV
jgi:hypothetical protein